MARGAEPGAIGNGAPLIALMQGQIPSRAVYSQVGTVSKVCEAISLAITLASHKIGSLPAGYNERAAEAIDTLDRLLKDRKFYNENLHIFNAVVTGQEDYLLGFNYQGKIGLSIELIQSLPTNLLAQYIFHEAIPEKGLVTGRADHRNVYQIMQTAIFGAEDVQRLKMGLRSIVNEKSGTTWPDPKGLPAEKRVLMLISGGESAGVNNYFAYLARKLAAKGYSLELVRFGLDGLVKAPAEFDGARVWVDWNKAEKIKDMPGAAEGTARVKLDDKKHPEYMANALSNLKTHCKTLVMIGGNDHLGEAGKISNKLKEEGIEMVVIALPKTIDRDTRVYPIGASSAGRSAN
ncbi:MAG: 6-phosphofructokinase, partial [Candidatus Omnitrophica bacterium]|nr:6-phosphofructokinase [Candidatus Omnitrophota bacterium]